MSSNLKPWLLLAVIFIVGVITGSALTFGLRSHFMHQPGAQMKQVWMEHLVQKLNLTADQQAKIQPILADADTKIRALHREEIEHGSQIFKAANDQIAALLTSNQKVKLQEMESDREKMFSGHMHAWGPPHDGPGGMFPHSGPGEGTPPPPPPASPPPATNTPPAAPSAQNK